MTTKLILPNRYWYLYKWRVGGENIQQKYEHLKTTFYPAFNFLLNLMHIRRYIRYFCKDSQLR